MRRHITHALFAAAAAGIAFLTLGFAGAGAPAAAAGPSLSPPVYGNTSAGYQTSGRWFRFVSATVTVPQPSPSTANVTMFITLTNTTPTNPAFIAIRPGGGSDSVEWFANGHSWVPFALSPKAGDQLAVSVYYDKRQGYTHFTANDLTQGITKTARAKTGSVLYNLAGLNTSAGQYPPSPPADTRMFKVADAHVTTYTGQHGTLTGPWHTSKLICTTDGTAEGAVVASPSGLSNGNQNFGIWLRHQ